MTSRASSSRSGHVLSRVLPVALYLALSAVVMWPAVVHLTSRTVYPYGDSVQMIWANGWVAHAVTHFHNPFFSPNVMAPYGTNLLASPCAVGLAILLIPVTLLFGSVASFNIQLLFMPVVSAAAFFYAGRVLVPSRRALWLGGLVWGFSPFVMSSLNIGWTNVGYQFFIPLLLSVIVDELYLHRRSSWRNGVYAGLLTAAQITIGSEVVASTAMMLVCLGVVFVAVHLWRHRTFETLVRPTWLKFIGGFAAPTLLLTLPLALYIVVGPSHLADWVWDEGAIRANHVWHLSDYVGPTLSALNPILPPMAVAPTYFGWALLVALVGCAWYARESVLTRVGVVTAALGVWLTLGESAPLSVWKLVYQLPVVHNVLAVRLEVWPWFGAALVVTAATYRYVRDHQSQRRGQWVPRIALVGLLSWAVVSFHEVLPVTTAAVQSFPAVTALGRERPGINLLAWPFQESGLLMLQQTRDGFTTVTPGTYGPSIRTLNEREQRVSYALFKSSRFAMLDDLLRSKKGRQIIRNQIAAWNVRAIVVPITIAEPLPAFAPPSAFQVQMTRLYGVPEIRNGSFIWDPARSTPPRHMPSPLRILYCLARTEHHPARLPSCLISSEAR